jgi:hypothetical protein
MKQARESRPLSIAIAILVEIFTTNPIDYSEVDVLVDDSRIRPPHRTEPNFLALSSGWRF